MALTRSLSRPCQNPIFLGFLPAPSAVTSDGGTRPYRVHMRDPSFNNLQAISAMCDGSQIADVVVAVASIDPVMGGVDR